MQWFHHIVSENIPIVGLVSDTKQWLSHSSGSEIYQDLYETYNVIGQTLNLLSVDIQPVIHSDDSTGVTKKEGAEPEEDKINREEFFSVGQLTEKVYGEVSMFVSGLLLDDFDEPIPGTNIGQLESLSARHPYWSLTKAADPEVGGKQLFSLFSIGLLGDGSVKKEDEWLGLVKELMTYLNSDELRVFFIRGRDGRLILEAAVIQKSPNGEIVDSSPIISIQGEWAENSRSFSEEIAYKTMGNRPIFSGLSYLNKIRQELSIQRCKNEECLENSKRPSDDEYVSPFYQEVQLIPGDMVDAYGLPFNLWLFIDYFEGVQAGFNLFGYDIPAKKFNALRPELSVNFGESIWKVTSNDFPEPEDSKAIYDKGLLDLGRLQDLNNAIFTKLKRAMGKG